MDVEFRKTGVVAASGTDINENHAINSSLYYDGTDWGNVTYNGWDFTAKNGLPCIHKTGALQSTYTLYPKTDFQSNGGFTPYNGLELTYSMDVLLENVVKGTTNYYLALYPQGETIDGTWRGATRVTNSGHFLGAASDNLNPDVLNGKGWTRVWVAYRWGDYAWANTNTRPYIYARDFTGDVYIRNFKVEYGIIGTPWVMNKYDVGFVGNSHGMIERSIVAPPLSIYEEHIEAVEFIEF